MRTTINRGSIALASLAVSLCALAACGSNGGNDPDPAPRVSAATTTSVTAVEVEGSFSIDISNQREVAGFASNVFVGTVTAQAGTETVSLNPATQFNVDVKQNLKGTAPEKVVIYQEAGIDPQSKTLVKFDGDSLVKVGETYVFGAKLNEGKKWYTLVPVTGHELLAQSTLPAQRSTQGADFANLPAVAGWRSSIASQILPKGTR